ncbi:MAG TPA: TetR/AcrR family transcriptional regulator [Rhizobiaceae bacterium]|nr:TetR/AcrR family transcriptional regulator [Rhizobiaceae bacterium]
MSSKKSSRLKILLAADELAHDLGPGNLSLDAVAHRAGVSKGGLLYHFPTKARLLEALVEHHIETFDSTLTKKEKTRSGERQALLAAYLDLVMADFDRKQPPPSGVLAALAENPELIAPIRDYNRLLLDRLKANAANQTTALIVFLALEGMRAMQVFGLDVLTLEEREAVVTAFQSPLYTGKS